MKRLIGRPQEALLCAKAKRQRQMFYLCESEAATTTKRPVGRKSHAMVRLYAFPYESAWIMNQKNSMP
ncbi:hypothetical protein [Lysinibacillus sp. NPDC056232]|uniref:hypothetical protein n=1 Tax=Lysinibacillus sp. NPDC056232 TaxID=3345756 RepID=UPI0035DDEA76